MKTPLVVLIGLGWIGCGPFLAFFMGKRGYDAFSWLAVGSLMGPAALAIALMERLPWNQPLPELVVRGNNAGGSINVLVLVDVGIDVAPVATPLIEWFGGCVGRLTVGRVLPEGGPLEEKSRATRAIREVVERLKPCSAEGLLLYGLTESAVGAIVRDGCFHVVITASPHRAVRDAIAGTDVLYVDGPQYFPQLTSAPRTRREGLRRTTTNWTRR